jgi:hypothetical protein
MIAPGRFFVLCETATGGITGRAYTEYSQARAGQMETRFIQKKGPLLMRRFCANTPTQNRMEFSGRTTLTREDLR